MFRLLPRLSRTPRTMLLALVLAAIPCLCFLFWRGDAVAGAVHGSAPAAPAYDQTAAINLTGEQVPTELDGFYLFVTEPDRTLAEQSVELAAKLQQAAAEHDYLGIIGPDSKHNHQTLIEALRLSGAQRLDGLTVIYLGPSELADDVAARLSAAGAELRYVVYPTVASSAL